MSDRILARSTLPVRDNSPEIAKYASARPARLFHAKEAANPRSSSDLDFSLLLRAQLPPALLAAAAREASRQGVPLRDFLIASGVLDPATYRDVVAGALGFPMPGHGTAPVCLEAEPDEAWRVLESGAPVRMGRSRKAGLNVQAMPARTLASVGEALGAARRRVFLLTRQALVDAVVRAHGQLLLHRATFGLLQSLPELSARTGIVLWQSLAMACLLGVPVGALLVAPRDTLAVSAAVLSILFLLSIAMRVAAACAPVRWAAAGGNDDGIPDSELPVYTVLVPLFREAAILPHLAAGLRELDYPAAKLDIKIILESVDAETIEAATHAGFAGNVDIIVVPDSQPRTKPKALNFALNFATGDYAVIYDAEDRPEPDQLRRAVSAFRRLPPDVVCLQARLDYYNPSENWLTRQFTIEYASLFRGLLPFFGRFRIPLPLGGTSNHFRMDVLRQLGAWDAFNVTEDADLGMRLCRAGYRAEMLDSTTYEEAVRDPKIWLRQRTRWLKGWMQTYGVHMRSPVELLRRLGARGYLGFQLYFAGIILAALCHPILHAVLLYDLLSGHLAQGLSTGADRTLYALAAVNFFGGYAATMLLGLVSLRRAGHRGLRRDILLIPLYWLFIAAAAYRAVWQLVRAPFYWEKTPHGHSAAARASDRKVGTGFRKNPMRD